MKVAINTLSQGSDIQTGLYSYFAQLAKFLPQVDPGTEYTLLVSRTNRKLFDRYQDRVQLREIGWSNENRLLRVATEQFLIGPWLAANGYDALFMANAGVAPLLLPRRTKLVLGVFGLHQFDEGQVGSWVGRYRRRMFAHSIGRADICLLNSQYSHALLSQQADVPQQRIRIVYHGQDGALFNPGPVTQDEKALLQEAGLSSPYVLFVSQIYPYKNLRTLVEGFCRVMARHGLPHKLVINGRFSANWGEGQKARDEVNAIAGAHGLADRLVFLENTPVRALRALYVAADVYAQPSLAETFGRTTVEAMACGCPVVAARAGATPEILGSAGILFEPLDAEACAATLEKVLTDAQARRAMVELGLKRAEDFTFEAEARALAAIFAELAQGHHSI